MKRESDGLLDGIDDERESAPLGLILGVLLLEAAVMLAVLVL